MRHAALNVVAIALIGASVVTSTLWAQQAAAPEDAPDAPTFAPEPLDLGFEEAAAIWPTPSHQSNISAERTSLD